jgi:hypothetical protein
MPSAPPVTVTQLVKQQEKNKLKEQHLQEKGAKIKAFQGLPPVHLEWLFLFMILLTTARRILN